jgi:hypothetical protein
MCILHKVSYTCSCPDKLIDREKCPEFIQEQTKHYDDAKEIKDYNLAAKEGRHREMECYHEKDHIINHHEPCRQHLSEAQQKKRDRLQVEDMKAREARRGEKGHGKSGNGRYSDDNDKTIKASSSSKSVSASRVGSSTAGHIYPPEIQQAAQHQAREAHAKNPRDQRPPPPLSQRSLHPGIKGHLPQPTSSSSSSSHAVGSSKDGPEWI